MNSIKRLERFFDENGKPVQVLRFIHEHTLQSKQSPTIREICDGCNVPSTSTANYYIKELMKLGCIECPERTTSRYAKSRFLRLTEIGLNKIGLETVTCPQCGSHIVGKVHKDSYEQISA